MYSRHLNSWGEAVELRKRLQNRQQDPCTVVTGGTRRADEILKERKRRAGEPGGAKR
jgi:hypothetical protein